MKECFALFAEHMVDHLLQLRELGELEALETGIMEQKC